MTVSSNFQTSLIRHLLKTLASMCHKRLSFSSLHFDLVGVQTLHCWLLLTAIQSRQKSCLGKEASRDKSYKLTRSCAIDDTFEWDTDQRQPVNFKIAYFKLRLNNTLCPMFCPLDHTLTLNFNLFASFHYQLKYWTILASLIKLLATDTLFHKLQIAIIIKNKMSEE